MKIVRESGAEAGEVNPSSEPHTPHPKHQHLKQAGMDDYISKPVERKKLYEIIAKWTMVNLKTLTTRMITKSSFPPVLDGNVTELDRARP